MIKNITFLRIVPFFNQKQYHPRDVILPYSIGYMVPILEENGVACKVIDTWVHDLTTDQVVREVLKNNSDYIAIESFTNTIPVALEIFSKLKAKGSVVTILFGQHASILPETVLNKDSPVDFCIREEPEYVMLDLIKALSDDTKLNKVKGLGFYDNNKKTVILTDKMLLLQDLDKLPRLKYELFFNPKYQLHSGQIPAFKKLKWSFMMTSRGCPYNCIYCSPTLRISYGKKFRAHSPERIISDLEFLQEKGINAVYFADDLATFNKDRMIKICDLMIERKIRIKWIIQTRADCLTRELLVKMKKAGCTTLCLGVESANQRILDVLQKSESIQKMKQVIRQAKKLGFLLNLYFMIGNPTETYDEMMQTFRFIKKFRPLIIQVAFCTPYPGSWVYEHLSKKQQKYEDYMHYDAITENLSRVPTKKLKKMKQEFYRKYYFSLSYFWNYLLHRAPYKIFNLKSELKVVMNTIRISFRKK